MKKIEFICSLSHGSVMGGETRKNDILYEYIKRKGYCVNLLDLEKFKNKKFILLIKIVKSLLNRESKEIYISKSSYSAYKYLKIAKYINIHKKKIYYFVIGGSLDKIIKNNNYNLAVYNICEKIYLETEGIYNNLKNMGISQVEVIPNFKKFIIRDIIKKEMTIPLKAVFISRISREKGVDMIFEMVKKINRNNIKINVDFYGPIDSEYKNKFEENIKKIKETYYKGILDLDIETSYDTLEKYNLMLFPTFWEGEGFPGVFIDSFIVGLPIVASDWNYNKEIIRDNEIGWLFEAKNQIKFEEIMKKIIDNPESIKEKSERCYEESKRYHVDKVLNHIIKRKD